MVSDSDEHAHGPLLCFRHAHSISWYGGGGEYLLREETCLEKFPVLGGGGMIGGGGCRIKYVMWMDGLVGICVVCLAAVNTAAINTGFYPSGHFRLPTTCSCQLIVSAVSTDTVFSVGRSL